MTESEQQAATETLAKEMGWRRFEWNDAAHHLHWEWFTDEEHGPVADDRWSPFDRLDDVRIVEDWIEQQDKKRPGLWNAYEVELVRIIGIPSPHKWIRLTAAQRAEACLRVIG